MSSIGKLAMTSRDEEVSDSKSTMDTTYITTLEKNEMNIDVVKMTRGQFSEAIAKMTEAIKDRKLPKGVERFRNREIISESLKKRVFAQNNPKTSNFSIHKRVVLY